MRLNLHRLVDAYNRLHLPFRRAEDPASEAGAVAEAIVPATELLGLLDPDALADDLKEAARLGAGHRADAEATIATDDRWRDFLNQERTALINHGISPEAADDIIQQLSQDRDAPPKH